MSANTPDRAQLYKGRAISGVKWTTVSTALTTGCYLLQTVVLARLLEPRDFGLMAMAMVVISVAVAYVDMGLSSAIIQRQHCTENELSSLYWLNVCAGLVVFAAAFGLAPVLAAIYREPKLTHIVQLSALVFVLGPIGQQYQLLLQKELLFRPLAIIDVSAKAMGTVAAITAAFMGAGVYSLVLGQLTVAGGSSLLLVLRGRSSYRPKFHFAWSDVRTYLGFGLYQMGERGINSLHDNLDKLLIGFWLGAESLGYYNFAWNLALMPVSRINPILTRTAFPLFSRLQDDLKLLRDGYLKLLKIISTINFPLFLGLCAVAPLAVPLIFGAKWVPAIPLVQILSLVGVLYCIGNPIGSLVLARGRADLGFWWMVWAFCLQAIAIALSAWLGNLVTVSLTLLGLQVALFFASYFFLIKPLLGRCLLRCLYSLLPSLLCSMIMFGAVIALRTFMGSALSPGYFTLAALIGLGGIVYLLASFAIQKQALRDLFAMLLHRDRSRSTPPANSPNSPATATSGVAVIPSQEVRESV